MMSINAQEMPVVGYMQELALQPLISHKARGSRNHGGFGVVL